MNLITLLFAIGISTCLADIEVTVEDVAVLVGEDAVVPCTYSSDLDASATITWYAKTNGTQQRLYQYVKGDSSSTFQDAAITRKLSVDDGNLIISDTTLEDNLQFPKLKCEVQIADNSESADATLVIAKLPEGKAQTRINEYLNGENAFDVSSVKTNIGTCTSQYGYPTATIEFYRENGDGEVFAVKKTGLDVLVDVLDPVTVEDGADGITTSTTKELLKTLDEKDHQAKFICSVITQYGDKVDVQNFSMPKFNVNFDTNKVDLVPSQEYAYLGDTITLKCNANGFPEPNVLIDGKDITSIEIEVTEDVDGKTYTCTAENGGDTVETSYTLNVLSLSEPVVTGRKQIMVGEMSILNCSAAGTPEPELAWYKDDAKVSGSGLLEIEDADFELSGEYRCQASNGHDSLKKSTVVEVDVIGLKREQQEEMVKVTGKKDEEVTLECVVVSNPEAEFTWSDEEAIATPSRSGYTYQSTITVGPLTPELSQKEYVCTATNAQGAKLETKFVLPEIKDNSTAHADKVIEASSSPVAGIIIAILVTFLIIGIIIAVLYNKGIICKKQEKGEESAEGDIAVEINNDEDVEHGNAKPEENAASPEEEKLMNGEGTNE